MKVISAYPVLVQKQGRIVSAYSSLDGGSNTAQIKNFQNWCNKIKGTKLVVDGKWGTNTSNAYKQHGAAYEAAASALSNTLSGAFGPDASGGSSPTSPGTKAPRQKGQLFDKMKNLWGKAKDSGAVDTGKNLLGQTKLGQKYMPGQSGGGADTTNLDYSSPSADSGTGETKKLLTGKNIAIGAGLIVGVIVLVVILKKKK